MCKLQQRPTFAFPFNLPAQLMADKGEVWQRLVDKHGLQVGGCCNQSAACPFSLAMSCCAARRGLFCCLPDASIWPLPLGSPVGRAASAVPQSAFPLPQHAAAALVGTWVRDMPYEQLATWPFMAFVFDFPGTLLGMLHCSVVQHSSALVEATGADSAPAPMPTLLPPLIPHLNAPMPTPQATGSPPPTSCAAPASTPCASTGDEMFGRLLQKMRDQKVIPCGSGSQLRGLCGAQPGWAAERLQSGGMTDCGTCRGSTQHECELAPAESLYDAAEQTVGHVKRLKARRLLLCRLLRASCPAGSPAGQLQDAPQAEWAPLFDPLALCASPDWLGS